MDTLGEYPRNYDPDYDTVFLGVVVRDGESANNPFYVKSSGETLALVQGPVAVGDTLGPDTDYSDYPTTGAYFVKGGSNGKALMAIKDTSIKLIKVNLGVLDGGDGDVWLP